MCLGISGSPMLSLKSKAEALKYAIEFTSTGEYPNRQYNMKKAKELFDFICENVKLPDIEVDQLSNSLIGFISSMEKLNKKKAETQDKEMGIAGEGEEPVKEEGPRPCSSALSNLYKSIEAHTKAVGLKPYRGEGTPEYTKQTFILKGIDECLWVTLEHVLPHTK